LISHNYLVDITQRWLHECVGEFLGNMNGEN